MNNIAKGSMIVRGRYLLTGIESLEDRIRLDAAVHIKDGTIDAIDCFDCIRARFPEDPVIGDGTGLVMPGLIDAHSHGRGLSPLSGGLGYGHLEPWLGSTWKMPDPGPYWNSLYSALRHIRSGFTTMHYFHIPRFPLERMAEDLEQALRGLRATGIRVAVSVPIRDCNFLAYDDEAFLASLPRELARRARQLIPPVGASIHHEFEVLFSEFYRRHARRECKVLLGPNGPQWCSDALLETVMSLAERYDTRVHMHALQTVIQRSYGHRIHARGLIASLRERGFLGPRFTLAHAIWLTDRDIDAVAESGTSITHHAGCNLKMRNGIAPVDAYLRAGVRVAMGLDDKPFSEDEDGFQEMRLIALLHRINSHSLDVPCISSQDVLRMATVHAAEVTGFGAACGRLEVGALADLILLDVDRLFKPWTADDVDLRDLLVFRGLASDVNTVIIGGQVVMKDRQLTGMDETEVVGGFRDAVRAQPKRDGWRNELKPWLARFYTDWSTPVERTDNRRTSSPRFHREGGI